MGTDIHPAVEVRKNGTWRLHAPKILCRWYAEVWDDQTQVDAANQRALAQGHPEWQIKMGDRKHGWDKCKYRLPEAFDRRNYAKFAVLGNVRNGYGFAGVKTFEPLQAMSDSRGWPEDADPKTLRKLTGDHSDTYVSLAEMLEYDLTQPLGETGVLSERDYLECLYKREDPKRWSGGISGQDIVVLSPKEYLDLFGKKVESMFGEVDPSSRKYDPTKKYHIQYNWMVPLATAVPDVIEIIDYLKAIVPKGGTPDDVRLLMNFDS